MADDGVAAHGPGCTCFIVRANHVAAEGRRLGPRMNSPATVRMSHFAPPMPNTGFNLWPRRPGVLQAAPTVLARGPTAGLCVPRRTGHPRYRATVAYRLGCCLPATPRRAGSRSEWENTFVRVPRQAAKSCHCQ